MATLSQHSQETSKESRFHVRTPLQQAATALLENVAQKGQGFDKAQLAIKDIDQAKLQVTVRLVSHRAKEALQVALTRRDHPNMQVYRIAKNADSDGRLNIQVAAFAKDAITDDNSLEQLKFENLPNFDEALFAFLVFRSVSNEL